MTRKLRNNYEEEYQRIPLDDYTRYCYLFDLGATTALVSAGFELVSLDKTNPHKVQFIFKRAKGIEKVIDDYWADRLEVKARKYFDNLKMLKNRIYS